MRTILASGRAATLACVLLAMLALGACGGDDNSSSDPPSASSAGFPVTIEHRHGTTTIKEPPKRVVTLGYNDHDFVLALGVTPVAVRTWFGDQPEATWPWGRDELGEAKPEVLPSEAISIEQVAALKPDLIVGVYSGITKDEYAKLSKLAPVVPQTKEHPDYAVPWQDQTRVIAKALGKSDEADTLVVDIERQFTAAREEHPEFADATALFAYRQDGGTFGAYSSADPRGRFLGQLGFRPATDIDDEAGDQFFLEVSGEQLRRIDRDVLVMIDLADIAADRDALLEDPLFKRLDVVRDGRDVYPSRDAAAALSFSSPLSLPYALETIVPQLADAVNKTS